MRLVIDIDKEVVASLLTFSKPSPDEKKLFLEYLDTHDEVGAPAELMEDQEVMLTLSALALAAVGCEIGKKR